MEPAASRNPEVDHWFEAADRPLDGKLVRTMRFAGLDELEAGRPDLEAAVRAWCDWKGG